MVKVLVDPTVRAAAKVAGSRWVGRPISQTAQELDDYWRNGGPGGRLATVRLEIPSTRQGSTKHDLECLAALTSDKCGAVRFCTSALIEHEIQTQPRQRYRAPFAGIHLFSETNFEHLPTTIDLRIEYLTARSLTEEGRADGKRQVTLLIRALQHPWLEALLKYTGNNKEADSFHILTAQINNCAYFLTMDTRLLSHFDKSGLAPKLPWLSVRIVSPETLACDLRIPCVDLEVEIEKRSTWGFMSG